MPLADEFKSAFPKREVELYKMQLSEYLELVKAMDARPIKADIYFPMIQHFEVLFAN